MGPGTVVFRDYCWQNQWEWFLKLDNITIAAGRAVSLSNAITEAKNKAKEMQWL